MPCWTQGFLAVDLFFVLSGFVISLAHADEFAPSAAPRAPLARRFLVLRLARIYPLHAVMLVLFLLNPLALSLFSAQGDPGPRYAPAYFVESLLLVQNWGFAPELAWNVPAWSISTEWFAYLLFPLLAGALLRLARPASATSPRAIPSPTRPSPPEPATLPPERRWVPLLLAAALLVALAVAAHAAGGLGGSIERFGLLRCVLEFAVGLCVFRLWRATAPAARRRWAELATLVAVLLVVAWLLLPLLDGAVLPLAFALLVFALAERRSTASRLLSAPLLERVGTYSYATYLCHYFVRDWVRFLLLPAGSLAPGRWGAVLAYVVATAVLSVPLHRWVEVPGRRLGRRWANRMG